MIFDLQGFINCSILTLTTNLLANNKGSLQKKLGPKTQSSKALNTIQCKIYENAQQQGNSSNFNLHKMIYFSLGQGISRGLALQL